VTKTNLLLCGKSSLFNLTKAYLDMYMHLSTYIGDTKYSPLGPSGHD